ncbi:Ferrichrome-iron receptor [Klebsiella spallanzanii]|jgi:iron complex outermembrane receptor protein|uniref:Ferrichrome-iron receptor n=1 Tax=Klebsiella spallanzanii TaxID=2587528 RepID=A0A564LH57_9ENTR|nr:TonB-dependent siderophore receptor [Klebsiella spallanzanii]MDM4207568.1 TonB-dependent siderophore receptor [Klebsiella spallanzanii]VUS62257.1 Ferrichrome-iron receptor [Klebsiella spallanzanii]VUS80531.1 Ferrichrome-iron receptor [Klebsiella spallanzanii]
MAVFSVLRAFRTQHIALALAAALPVSSVYAATTLSLSLPSQSLASSLNQLARQANVQLIAAPVNLAGKTAPAVSGTMTLESALGQLLSGSGLSWKLNGDTVSVVPAAAGEETLTVTGGLNASSTVAQQTTSGTKTDTPLLEVPQSVSVITRQQLDRQNVQSVTEALRYVPGVKTETYGVDPKGYDWIYIRGFNALTTNDYRDGLRQLNNSYSYFRTEPYALERIDIVRGPSSTLFGLGDAGGIVNRVSKMPDARGVHEIEVQLGNFNRRQAQFDLSDKLDEDGQWLYRVIGLARDSDTQFQYRDGPHVEDNRLYLAPTLTWLPSADTSLTLRADYLRDTSGGTIAVLTKPGGKTTDTLLGDYSYNRFRQEQFTVGYEFSQQLTEGLQFRQNLRFGQTDTILNNLLPGNPNFTTGTLTRNAVRFDEHMQAFNVDNQLQMDFATAAVKHTLLAGVDYSWLEGNAKRFGAVAPPLNINNPVYGVDIPDPTYALNNNDQTTAQLGLYLQDQIHLTEQWLLTLGGRHDDVSMRTHNNLTETTSWIDKDAWTGRAGITYLAGNGLAPYVSYAESFVPNSGTDSQNRTFDPSKAHQYEVGVKYQPHSNLLMTLAAFEITKTNVLTNEIVNGVATGYQVASGEVRSRGIEWETQAQLTENIDALASYTWTDAEITKSNNGDEGKQQANVPKHMASAWMNYGFHQGLLDGLMISTGVRYVGSLYGDNANTVPVKNFTLVDAGVKYQVNKNIQVGFNIQNLLDHHYVGTCDGDTSCYPGQERTFIGSLKLNF